MSTKSIVGIIAVIALVGGGAAFFCKKGGINHGGNKVNVSINTKLNVTQKDKEKGTEENLKLEIKNASLIAKNNGLKQRISLEKGSLSITGTKKDTNFELKNIDIIADNEKVYGKGDLGKMKDTLKELDVKSIFGKMKEDSYIQINNAKPFLALLGKNAENELVKEIIVGMVTSNPKEYYIQHNTGEKVLALLKTDAPLNFVFKDGKYDEVTKRTNLLLNEKICDLGLVILNVEKVSKGEKLSENLGEGKEKEECLSGLEKVNMALGMVNIYKEGDSKGGNFKFIISQGTLIDISIKYKKHIINTRSINMADPLGKISLSLKGKAGKIISSALKIDSDNGLIKVKGEIIDGTGKVTIINSKKDPKINIDGSIEFEGYTIKSYELHSDANKVLLVAKGNASEGDIKITSGDKGYVNINYTEKQVKIILKSEELNINWNIDSEKLIGDWEGKKIGKGKITMSYQDLDTLSYDVEIDSKILKMTSKGDVKKEYIDLNFDQMRRDGSKTTSLISAVDFRNKKANLKLEIYKRSGKHEGSFTFDYNKGKIKGAGTWRDKTLYTYNGMFKNLGDFNMDVDVIEGKISMILEGKKEKEVFKYTIGITQKEEKVFQGEADVSFKDNQIKSQGKMNVLNEKFEGSYDFEFDYTTGGVEYTIPKTFEEVEINILQAMVLPDLTFSIRRIKKETMVAVGLIFGGIFMGGVVDGFITSVH